MKLIDAIAKRSVDNLKLLLLKLLFCCFLFFLGF